MTGNVWQWCSDRWGHYSPERLIDPIAPPGDVSGVYRGGGWPGPVRADCGRLLVGRAARLAAGAIKGQATGQHTRRVVSHYGVTRDDILATLASVRRVLVARSVPV